MRTRLVIIAVPALLASVWFGGSGAVAASAASTDADAARLRVDLVVALANVSVELRDVQIRIAGQPAGQLPELPTSTQTRQLADATNALQRVISTSDGPWRWDERAAIEEVGVRLGAWGDALNATGAAAPAARAPGADVADLAVQVSDALTTASVKADRLTSAGAARLSVLAATVDRLDRAARADVGVLINAMTVLATPVAQRVGVARDVGTARRAAAQLLAATTPALDDETRRSVLELTGGGGDAFLASFADDETVRSLSSPPSSLIDATIERSAGWASIQRDAATRLRKEVDRLVDRSSGAARDAWALFALLIIGSTGVTLMLVARTVRSIEVTRAKAATTANAADTISSAARTEITAAPIATAASALVAPPALDESGALACLIEFARAHRAALDEQLDVFDRLDVGDGGPRQIALAQDLERSILRIRRLSEAVLVMAGAEAARSSFDPQPLATVLDAAIGEVGGTGAISWSGADGFQVSGEAMIDVAHLVAELLDLSRIVKIDSDVVIKIRTADADRVLMVLEHALGNENPVDVASIDAALHGTWVADGIGWMAAGELARRRGIDVALDESSGAGVLRVAVMVPGGVISDPTRQHEAGMIPTNKEESMVWGWTSAGEYLPATGWRPDGDFVAAPARLSDAVPTGDAFETGLSTLLESGTRADSRSGAGNS